MDRRYDALAMIQEHHRAIFVTRLEIPSLSGQQHGVEVMSGALLVSFYPVNGMDFPQRPPALPHLVPAFLVPQNPLTDPDLGGA